MRNIVAECNDFLKDCGLTYAFCGGYALELFLGIKLRSHSDIDTTVFDEDKNSIIGYILKKGWNIYDHRSEWIDNKEANSYLRLIASANDEGIANLRYVWAVKPGCLKCAPCQDIFFKNIV